jgi:hypothetical protein
VDDAVLTKFLFDNRPEAPWAGHIDGHLSMSVQHQRGIVEDLRDARRSTKAVLARERRIVLSVLLHSQGKKHALHFCPICLVGAFPKKGSPSRVVSRVCNILKNTRVDGENHVVVEEDE